jgi:hypothetical protein
MPKTCPPVARASRWLAFLVVCAAVGGWGCSRQPPAEPPSAWFADVSAAVGLDFVHDAGPVDGKYFMPQIVGSGAALFDFDGDGRLDIYLLQNGGPRGKKNALFKPRPGVGAPVTPQGRGGRRAPGRSRTSSLRMRWPGCWPRLT